MKKKRPRKQPRFLTPQEFARLVSVCATETWSGLRLRVLIDILVGTGARVSELCSLLVSHVDLDNGYVHIKEGKGDVDRVVPVDEATNQWISAWYARREVLSTYVMCTRVGGRLSPRQVQQMIGRICRKAGLHKVTPHTFRHTYATDLLREGFSIREVQRLLGHSRVTTTEIYTHVQPLDLRLKIRQRAREKPA